jgi:hypothetical protein
LAGTDYRRTLFVALLTAPMPVVKSIGGAVSGLLPLVANGSACRRISISTQVQATPRNANKANSLF